MNYRIINDKKYLPFIVWIEDNEVRDAIAYYSWDKFDKENQKREPLGKMYSGWIEIREDA